MRKRVLNVKLLALVVGLGVLLGGGADLVDRLQHSRTARGLLREVDLAEAKGEYGRAEQVLEPYPAIRPREHAARARDGLVLDRQGMDPRARLLTFLALEEVLRRAPASPSGHDSPMQPLRGPGDRATARGDRRDYLTWYPPVRTVVPAIPPGSA
jgi:hypothetical protein